MELADARDSKSRGSDTVSVRPRPAAPLERRRVRQGIKQRNLLNPNFLNKESKNITIYKTL